MTFNKQIQTTDQLQNILTVLTTDTDQVPKVSKMEGKFWFKLSYHLIWYVPALSTYELHQKKICVMLCRQSSERSDHNIFDLIVISCCLESEQKHKYCITKLPVPQHYKNFTAVLQCLESNILIVVFWPIYTYRKHMYGN